MKRVALATCDMSQFDPLSLDEDQPLLLEALERLGVAASAVAWNDEDVDWTQFDLVVVRSTWDYTRHYPAFMQWAKRQRNLLNPLSAIAYSSDKRYLKDLHERGVPVVTTHYCEPGMPPHFPSTDFVVKPCIGAGSIDADRYRADEGERALAHVARLHARGATALIQPYVASVDTLGERALVFIDGAFSHAMTKAAMLNTAPQERNALFRREQMSLASADPAALTLARAVLREAAANLLYARVDLVSTLEGWALMELELVEPSLFLAYHPVAAGTLAAAIAARL